MSVDTFLSSTAGQNSGGQEEGSRLPARSRGVPSAGGGGPEELSNTEEEHLAGDATTQSRSRSQRSSHWRKTCPWTLFRGGLAQRSRGIRGVRVVPPVHRTPGGELIPHPG